MSSVVIHVFKMSVFSSIMILAVIGLKGAFRGRLHINIISFMWIVVLARLLPFTLSSPVNIGNILFRNVANIQTEAAEVLKQSQLNDNSYYTINDDSPYTHSSGQPFSERKSHEYTGAQQREAEMRFFLFDECLNIIKGISLMTYLFNIWLAGVCVVLTVNIRRMISFCIKVNTEKRPLRASTRRLLNKNKEVLGIKKDVEIIVGNHIDVSFAFGFMKPKILISKKLMDTLDEQKIDFILMHELCHIKRWDIIKIYLWMIARAFHWFNPLVRLAFGMYQNDIELACDDMVTSKLSYQERIDYSQSLIDVIRLSQYNIKTPLAAPFCKSKSSIKERIMNMLKLQKKSKLAGLISLLSVIILLITCFTTACQPTPEKLIVENKGDDELQEAIMQTALPITNTPLKETVEPLQELRITDTITNDAGTVTVDIDANVVLPGDGNITVARLKRDSFTQEEVENIIRLFFGDSIENLTFYDPDVTTKSDIQAAILSLQLKMTDEEAMLNSDYAVENGIADLEAIKRHLSEEIEGFKKKLADAPEEAPAITDLDIDKGFSASVGYCGDYKGAVLYDDDSRSSRITFCCASLSDEYKSEVDFKNFSSSTTTQIDADTGDPEFVVAKEAAEKLVSEMGIEGVRLGDVFIPIDNGEEEKSTELYILCYERVVGNRTIDFTLFEGGYTDDNEVSVTVPYEQFQIWAYGDKVIKLYWFNPLKVTKIINDNTALQIDYERALDTAINQIYINYSFAVENEEAEFISADITGIEFEMVRIKEKNSDYYISVPAWKIYGDVQEKLTEKCKSEMEANFEKLADDPHEGITNPEDYVIPDYVSLTSSNGMNIFTINALDGSIIDMEKGY